MWALVFFSLLVTALEQPFEHLVVHVVRHPLNNAALDQLLPKLHHHAKGK